MSQNYQNPKPQNIILFIFQIFISIIEEKLIIKHGQKYIQTLYFKLHTIF